MRRRGPPAGCAGVPLAGTELDAQAKKWVVPSDRSVIYVYRNERIGGGIKMEVTLDGEIAGKTGPKTFFMFVVEPGPHAITSEAESTDTLVLEVKPGKAYYVWQEVKVGVWFARTTLQWVDEIEGQKGVEECELVKSRF